MLSHEDNHMDVSSTTGPSDIVTIRTCPHRSTGLSTAVRFATAGSPVVVVGVIFDADIVVGVAA